MSDEEPVQSRPRRAVTADVIGGEVVLVHPVEDISLSGCRFAAPAWEPEGSELQLVITFSPSGASIPIAGLVVRANERDMGVRFHEISNEQKWALRKHIRDSQAH